MIDTSPALAPRLRQTGASGLSQGALSDLADDWILSKVSSAGMQAALAVLLSIFGLGSAMGQSIDQDMALGANTQATRDRVIAEIRQARADGAIRRWSPVLLDIPFKAPLKGSRFEPYATRQTEAVPIEFSHGDATASSAIPAQAPRTAP